MSFRTYTARRRLNRLRRCACQLFTSEAMVKAIQKLELEVEAKRLLMRKDRHIWKDIGQRQKVLNWLLSYNPLWLRIGLETIFGELISLESNNDVMGLAVFILNRLLWNPDIATEYRHPTVPHLYRSGHEDALSCFTLKKLLLLICFLDKAKESRMIDHDPCLFCMDAEFKSSKDLLLAFSRDFLSGEGILPRHLGHLGLAVSHVQTPLDEFDFAVKNLAVDLRCGIRLVRIMELFTQNWSLSQKLRMPAISRLQKVHNVECALKVLKEKGININDEHGAAIESRDIVDGHREKTITLLWKIIFAFQVFHSVLLDEEKLTDELCFLQRMWKTKQQLSAWKNKQPVINKAKETKCTLEHSSKKISLLMDWVNAVCAFYNVQNFTVSFSDGRILCYLIHRYHPCYLPLEAVCQNTTQTIECGHRGTVGLNCSSSDSDICDSYILLCADAEISVDFKALLENEKKNFQLVNDAIASLGGVPAMINPADMSNTIPNEKVVTCYLSFLCARLLDLRTETRAAWIIQGAWRKYRMKMEEKLSKQQNKAAVVIQAAFRMFAARKKFFSLKRAAVVLQQRYRAKQLGQKRRKEYLCLQHSVLRLQAVWRGRTERKQIKELHRAAVLIQSCYRRHVAESQFRLKRKAAQVIQTHYRARVLGKNERWRYVTMRKAVVILQATFRGAKHQRQDLMRMHQASTLIQAYFRMYKARILFTAARCAATVIQQNYRAYIKGRQQRQESFKNMKAAAVILQAFCRGWLVRKLEAQARRRQLFTAFVYHHLCAVKIQRALRAHWALESAKKQICSVICIQRWFRTWAQRRRYLEQQRKIITLQRAVKGWLSRRNKAATVIQQAARKYLLKRQGKRLQGGIIKAQALWRGHCSRRLNDTSKIIAMRHRFRKVNLAVKEEDKLCNKTAIAIDYLLKYKHFSYILAALKHLETATRLSPECCEHLVESGATLIIFTLIRSCNRSVPCMEVITYAIQVLLNLSKYEKTTEAVYGVEDSVETLLDLLQIYREKAGDKVADKGGSIFTKTCFLLIILLHDKQRALEVRKLPKAVDRIGSIYRLTVRKHKKDAERTMIKQKMNASLNGSFFSQTISHNPKPLPRYVQ
uniref:Calponin-homology (CH) domain-containing protein n=1 Tax=Scleropages formosus TaxID=113540 RepID=A0A8C9QX73_SCLFO